MVVGPGLCGTCAHTKRVDSARGTSFYLCGLSKSDPRYGKYPQLPVLACAGHQATPSAAPEGA
jgi:hypothetical protein